MKFTEAKNQNQKTCLATIPSAYQNQMWQTIVKYLKKLLKNYLVVKE